MFFNPNISFGPVFVLSLLFTLYKYYLPIDIVDFAKTESKPVIYGEDFCEALFGDDIEVTSGLFRKWFNLATSKPMIRATINDEKIILKTLTDAGNFKSIEDTFYSNLSEVAQLKDDSIDVIKSHINDSIRLERYRDKFPKFALCPQTASMDKFYSRINADEYGIFDYISLWVTLQANPEPVMLKLLQPPEWPVPKYYGSCGQVIAVEYVGNMLSDLYHLPWKQRAYLVYHIFQLALDFTFKDPDYAYYLIDFSPDNIAVSNDGKVKFIDLEHVIVCDRNPPLDGLDIDLWKTNYSSLHTPCKNCMMFSSWELCTHQLSDHNVYAVCKEILSDTSIFPGGFLHSRTRNTSSPTDAENVNKLRELMVECNGGFMRSRFETAQLLMKLLKEYFF